MRFACPLSLVVCLCLEKDNTALKCEEGENVHSLWYVGDDGGEAQVKIIGQSLGRHMSERLGLNGAHMHTYMRVHVCSNAIAAHPKRRLRRSRADSAALFSATGFLFWYRILTFGLSSRPITPTLLSLVALP